ncbi:hypothetical protein [Asaia bogorensis]|uniref:hypothetical protein n=1 Tax=Asaia bogorensis TaxID=91915 RepID=UPI00301B6AEA
MTSKPKSLATEDQNTLTTRPHSLVSLIKAGRGNLGGTTCLAPLAEISIRKKRKILLADGDVRNPGISQFEALYHQFGIGRPINDEAGQLKEWFANAFNRAAEETSSLIIDIGGGDRTLEEWAAEDDIVGAGDAIGLPVTGLFMCGSQPGDIAYLEKLWASGQFRPNRGIIVLNEWTVPTGHKPDTVLAPITTDKRLLNVPEMETAFLRIPKLSCMKEVLESGLTFHDAAAGKLGPNGQALGPMRQFLVQKWLERIEDNIEKAGIADWLP